MIDESNITTELTLRRNQHNLRRAKLVLMVFHDRDHLRFCEQVRKLMTLGRIYLAMDDLHIVETRRWNESIALGRLFLSDCCATAALAINKMVRTILNMDSESYKEEGGGENCAWVNVSITCAGEYVGLEEVDDGIWNVYFGPLKLGRLKEEHMRIEDAYGSLWRHKKKQKL